jgi:hypothetical protein
MASLQTLEKALLNADKAGDVDAVKTLVRAVQRERKKAGNAGGGEMPQSAEQQDQIGGLETFSRGARQGFTFNLADEIAGGGAQKKSMWDAATDPEYLRQLNAARASGDEALARELQMQPFQRGDEAQSAAAAAYRERDAAAREANPGTFFLGEMGGALATLPLTGPASATARLAPRAGLGARSLAASKDAAVYGAAYGAGSGEGLPDRITNAVSGGVAGGTIGAMIPGAITAGDKLTKPLRDFATSRLRPNEFAAQKISERIASDGTDFRRLEGRMSRGTGLSMADAAGQGTRSLLRTTVNTPGPAKQAVTARMNMRQMGQGERLKEVIRNTFADPDGYLSTKESIAEAARVNAGPLYRRAYENPVPFTKPLEDILKTPAGRKALSRAADIAGNEQQPFRQWFINVSDDGRATVKRVPDMRAWDYIKRGMDSIIDAETDAVTGKMTTDGRAIVGLKNRLLSHLDRANPDYAAARKIAADGFQLDEALEFGRKATSMSAEAVKRRMGGFSEAELQMARLGYAESLRARIDGAGWTHNKILQVMKSPEQYRTLRAMAPSGLAFKTMRQTIMDEARKQVTFNATRGNSTTAAQLADMADAGQLGEVGRVATDAARGNIMGLVGTAVNIMRRLGGLTPEVSKRIADRLTATNPEAARALIGELRAIEQRQISRSQKRGLVEMTINRLLGAQTAQAGQ